MSWRKILIAKLSLLQFLFGLVSSWNFRYPIIHFPFSWSTVFQFYIHWQIFKSSCLITTASFTISFFMGLNIRFSSVTYDLIWRAIFLTFKHFGNLGRFTKIFRIKLTSSYVVKSYKFSVIRYINSGNVMFSIMTIINNTVIITLKIAKRISLKSSQHKKKW